MRDIPHLLFICLLTLGTPIVLAQQYAFNSEEETIEGWYHSHDIQTWTTKGGDIDVIMEVLDKVERSLGAKRFPELADTQIEFGPGNWSYEWIQAGDRARSEANSLNGYDRLQKLRAALAYYSTGSWPHLGREDDTQALTKAIETYMAAGALMNTPVAHIDIPVGEQGVTSVKGYLHLPAGAGPFSIVINSFGSDVTKEDSFDLFYRELEPRGIGMLAVDMPGIGEAKQLSMADGSDTVMEAALQLLREADYAQQGNIFVVGGSFGGNAAARAFYRLEVAGVVSMCAPLHTAFQYPPDALDGLPKLTIDGVKSRFGLLDRSTAALSAPLSEVSLIKQGYMRADKTIDTPLLVITTNRDPVSPLEDLAIFLDSASNQEVIVLDMEGHCPPRGVREPVVARWIADQIRN